MSNVTVKVGLQFRSVIADCNALWEVKKRRGDGIWECEVVNEQYTMGGVTYDCEYAGQTKVFDERDIRHSASLEVLMSGLKNDNDLYYESLRPGQIVHYDNGFGQSWVRCEVVKVTALDRLEGGNALKPIALVGEWKEWDVYRRSRNGSVHYGYCARQVLDGIVMRPTAGGIYESPRYGRRHMKVTDPTSMKPVSLEAPPLSPDEQAKADLWSVLECAMKILQDEEEDPRGAILRAYGALTAVATRTIK